MKKTILSIIMAFFMAFSICLTGCKDDGLRDNPPTNATVISNGGMSVVKGDYLYFVNGYVDETTLTKDDNKAGKVTKGAIYRTKLSNNEISKDKDGFLNNADVVVSKVVGFSNGGFSIIDDYIYYATPYMKFSNDGTLQNNRVEFHRIKIDGTGDKVIYTTSASEDNLNWTLYKIGDTTYLVMYEGEKIVSINAGNGSVVGTVENTTSHVILEDSEHVSTDPRTNFNQTHIYYTRDITSGDGVYDYNGNAVCAFNIATGESATLELSRTNTYTIKYITKDTVYYTYTSTAKPIACLYKRSSTSDWSKATEVALTNKAYDAYYFADYGSDLIVATADDCTWLLENGTTKLVSNTARSFLGVYGNYIYYMNEGDLIRMDIRNGELQDAVTQANILVTNSDYIDFDNRRIYVYNQYTAENGETNYYLSYFDENYTEETFKHRFVGVFECDDIPEKPEQPEPEYEGDEVEYVPHID
jgi:hypothetical protein